MIIAKNSPDQGAEDFDYDLLPGLIGYNLRKAQAAAFQNFTESLKGCDITPGQFGVLVLIEANSGLNQTRLGNALGIDRSTVVAVIDRLEGRGLVDRKPAPSDRRSYALHLTEQGRALLHQARAHLCDDGLLVVEAGSARDALEAAWPQVSFTWLMSMNDDAVVFVVNAQELEALIGQAEQ